MAAFRRVHSARFTSVYEGVSPEIVSFRVRAAGPAPALTVAQADAPAGGVPLKGRRMAWFGDRFHDTPVYDRYALASEGMIQGPAIIEEREATTILGRRTV
ncbi:hypothetical protein [Falsiroseomonas tokyonensis]|uniref:Acetophenone carboxylase-like C-terminal domain-containing protein n=1 Tax=Falsiroseomonas tokyonensis TaxID=430521 RepID=A0ABV7C0Y3_9PROT|nr:hypothetical protein [Falsiroseomonas tokyonensis]